LETSRQSFAEPSQARLTSVEATGCAECLVQGAATLVSKGGEGLCAECAESFYAPCSACGGLLPLDEAVRKDAALYCLDCGALPPAAVAPEDVAGEAEVESLVAEYVALHAEEARVKKRLDEVKEMLKAAAAARQRVAGAVTLRAGDAAVRCSFKAALRCDEEKAAELERVLAAEQFASLFQRSVRYSPVKENLERLLSAEAAESEELRRVVLPIVERTEQATLTVVRARKGKPEA
jgi:hypothetical protein